MRGRLMGNDAQPDACYVSAKNGLCEACRRWRRGACRSLEDETIDGQYLLAVLVFVVGVGRCVMVMGTAVGRQVCVQEGARRARLMPVARDAVPVP